MKLKIGSDGLPEQCPRCESDDLCICNDEGLECMQCGCWFDADSEGNPIFIRASHPVDLSF